MKCSQKSPRSNEVTWKFALPLLSRAEFFCKNKAAFELLLLSLGKTFAKIRQFCWCDLKIWPTPIITGWNFLKNKAVLILSLENLNCPYYHKVKFLQKYPRFNEVIRTFELSPLSWRIIFSNIKQFWWCLSKSWPLLLSRSEIFDKIEQC